MSEIDRLIAAIFVAGFVFCTLTVLAPAPRDPARGDNKMFGAFLAAVFAAVVVVELTS